MILYHAGKEEFHCKTHQYDIVEGSIANDTIWNYVNDFLSRRITRKQF